jgi:hypothetical protein
MKPTSSQQRNRHSQPRAFARAAALIAVLCALAFANFATAQITYDFNQVSGNWHTTTHWTPNGTPTSIDTVQISGTGNNGSNRLATIAVGNTGYAYDVSLNLSYNRAGNLTVNGTLDVTNDVTVAAGSGASSGLPTFYFTQGNNTTVTIGNLLALGDLLDGNYNKAHYTMGTDATLSVGTLNIGAGYGGNGRFYMNNSVGSTVTVSGDVVIAEGRNQNVGAATGLLDQGTGTEVTIGGNLTIGSSWSTANRSGVSGGVYNLADGASLTVTGDTSIANGSFRSGKLALTGGTAKLSTLSMGASGTIEGYGTISGTTLTMNGTVRASGGTLDLSGFTSVVNSSGTGWFVENGGAITLPTTTVAAGDGGDFTWGARAASVNSVDLDFTGVTGGNLSITVLDPDTDSYLPGFGTPSPTTGSIVSLWEIDEPGVFNFGSGTVSLVFRYDDSRLGGLDESQLKVYHYTGSAWEELVTAIDPDNHTASVSGVNSFSPFAVGFEISGGIIPEPASLALLTLGTAWMLTRRRAKYHRHLCLCIVGMRDES